MSMETCHKTFKQKLKPTPKQECQLDEVLWRCRTLYNTALEQRITLWKQRGISTNRFRQALELKDIRADMSEYATVNSHVLQDVLARLEMTFQAFFRRLKNGEKPGFPRFQGRNRYHTFTYNLYGNGVRLDNGFLVLTRIGRIAVRWSRPVEGTIKTVTLSKEADGWYVCIFCTDVPVRLLPQTGCETGIDVGLKVFLITGDGNVVANPRHYRKAEHEVKKANQRVSRRKKGSKRWKKAVGWCAKKHQHVRRQRRDFHHKTVSALIRHYDTIYCEAIQPANMSRRPTPKPDGTGGYLHNGANRKTGLNKSILDAGWSQFLRILTFKAACAGKRVEAVNPAYTSQACSGCGEIVQKSLSVRTHVCTSCGLVMDRDENAARNIQWAGQALRGLTGIPAGMNREAASF